MKKFVTYRRQENRGFTLVELMVSVAIIAILSLVTYISLFNARSSGDAANMAKQMTALLRQAQSQTVSGYQGVAWGVHFGNATGPASSSFYALFSGGYSASSTIGYYKLPTDVAYLTSTLASGASTDVSFALFSGVASASTSVGLYSVPLPTQTYILHISSSGQVSY